MRPTYTITKEDYRRARIMLSNFTVLAPAGSKAAATIIANSNAIINLYEKQSQGVKPGKSAANILGMHVQYAKLFSETMKQKTL